MSQSLPDGQTDQKPRRQRSRSGSIAWALVLIALGTWFLLENLPGVNLPDMSQMWPIFVVGAGLAFLAGYVFGADHDPGLAFIGTAATLIGVFFFLTTLSVGGLEQSDIGRLWPVYPLIGGVAFVVQWVASGFKDWGTLIPATIGVLVGIGGLIAVLTQDQSIIRLLVQGWPIILIVVGIGLLLGYFVSPKR